MRIGIVGAGLAGMTAAVILRENGHHVEVFETRSHIGGNCYDSWLHGVLVHGYGPHGFHTNNERVWHFVNKYTLFVPTALKVWAHTAKGMIPVPFNNTSAEIVGDLSPEEIRDLIFVDYSEKHWGIPWKDIPKSITSRLPVRRQSFDGRYHLDKYQGVPEHGYSAMFASMADGIPVYLNCQPHDWRKQSWQHVIYTGSVDQYYDYCYGTLDYRSLRFEYESAPRRAEFQINECNSRNAWTRSVDHSHWLGQDIAQTVISREFPCEYDGANTPFYPKPFGGNQERYLKYCALAKNDKGVTFLGRLGTYKYLDMDDTIAQVMAILDRWDG